LKGDIAANGQLEPIWLYNGQIIDGRNRFRCCEALGKKPKFKEYKGTENELLAFIISLNLRRRHLNESQRGMAAAQIANMRQGERTDIRQICRMSQADAAKMFCVSVRTVGMAAKILREGTPEQIKKIDDGKWTIAFVISQLNRNLLDDVPKLPKGKFQIIYADPPWKLGNGSAGVLKHSGPAMHYPLMELDEIKDMDVAGLSAEDAYLFLWVVNCMLPDALEVMESWGFRYITNAVWVKGIRIGMGSYFRQKHELLLLGKKGKPQAPDYGNRVQSVIKADKREHSRKPDRVYEIIETMFPFHKKIELFGRGKPRKGWTVWGAEVDRAA
jgi:N6-adenosine-specific RNA methylase IME4